MKCLRRMMMLQMHRGGGRCDRRRFFSVDASGSSSRRRLDRVEAAASDLARLFDDPSTTTTTTTMKNCGGGLFAYKRLRTPADMMRAAADAERKAERLVQRMVNNQSTVIGGARSINTEGEGGGGGGITGEGRAKESNIVKALDRISDGLCAVLDAAELLQNVHPSNHMRNAARQAHQRLTQYLNRLNTHRGLYDAVKNALSVPGIRDAMSAEERRVADLLVMDFERSGIAMPRDVRERFVDLNDRILALGHDFAANSYPAADHVEIDDAHRRLAGVPPGIVRIGASGRARVPIAAPVVDASDVAGEAAAVVLRSARDEGVRREVFVGLNSASHRQIRVLEELLWTRGELARLLGKRSYAEFHLGGSDKMVRDPEHVVAFLTGLAEVHHPLAVREVDALREIKAKYTGRDVRETTFNAWDKLFYLQFLNPHSNALALSAADPFHPNHSASAIASSSGRGSSLSEYFSVGQTFAGMSNLTRTLYGITLEPAPVHPGELWHEDVRKLHAVHETEGVIGIVYCDVFARPSGERKYDSAAHFTVRCSRRIDDDDEEEEQRGVDGDESFLRMEDGERRTFDAATGSWRRYQMPVVTLVTSFERRRVSGGNADSVALLSLTEVETLFHEMGHVMHSMIGRTDFQHVAGTRCGTDFVEVPSNFMEQFAREPEVLHSFARHHRTGERPPLELLVRHVARGGSGSVGGGAALEVQNQLMMALLDQAYHSPAASERGFDTTATLRELQGRINVIPFVEGTAWQVQFSHLFSYGASYYSYFWARRWSHRLYRRLFFPEDGSSGVSKRPDWRESGEMIQRELLGPGGGRDPWVGLERLGVVNDGERDGRGASRAGIEDLGQCMR